MTTLYQTISAIRTAEGSPCNPELALDMFANDWSLIGGVQDLSLPEDTVVSATTSTWTALQTIWFEMPTYSLDVTFEDMEVVVALRVEAKADSNADCDLRLVNAAVSITGVAVPMTTNGTYAVQALMFLVFPLASIPTGRTEIKIQGRWNSDPGSKTLFTRRTSHTAVVLGDCEIFIRLVP